MPLILMVNKKSILDVSSSVDEHFNNVVLLATYDNVKGITDKTNKNTVALNTVYPATPSKFNDKSIYLSGSKYIGFTSKSVGTYTDLSGDFTIEFWMYTTIKGYNYKYVMGFGGLREDNSLCFGDLSGFGGGFAWRINGSLQYLNGIQIAVNTWQHHALVRSGNTLTHYVNGIAATSYSGTMPTFTLNGGFIGASDGGAYGQKCNLEELRVTKGVARYLENFTVPSARFPSASTTTFARLSDIAHSMNVFLSSNNVTATNVQYGWTSGRGDTPISSGKRYWEVRTSAANSRAYGMVGIIAANSPDANFNVEGYLGINYAKSIGYYVCTGGGAVYSNSRRHCVFVLRVFTP